MHLSGAWTDEASANSCNPCDRVSRGHSVGFTQFAVTADRTPRIFANAVSSCGIGYPRPGLARMARPLTYPSRSLPKRELGVSPPRSDPRFGPSCERIGYCRPMKASFLRFVQCARSNVVCSSRLRFFFFADAQSKIGERLPKKFPDVAARVGLTPRPHAWQRNVANRLVTVRPAAHPRPGLGGPAETH
jgi:hypothetical protein